TAAPSSTASRGRGENGWGRRSRAGTVWPRRSPWRSAPRRSRAEMNTLLARLRSYARQLRNAEGAYAEMDEQMRFQLQMEAERLQRERGLDPAEARRQAAVAFGGVEGYKEACQEARGMGWLGGLSLDVRLGVRMLRKYPGLSLVGVLGMAVAIAVGAGVFSLVRAVTDPALPLDEGDRIVKLLNNDLTTDDEPEETHLHDLEVWREELDAVA